MKKIILYITAAAMSLIVTFKIPAGANGSAPSTAEFFFTVSAFLFLFASAFLFIKDEIK